MPRKMNMKADSASAPMERPGASAPDESGVRRKPKAPETEAKVLVDPSMYDDERNARYEKREQLMEEAAHIKERQNAQVRSGEWESDEAFEKDANRLREIEQGLGIKRQGRKAEIAPVSAPTELEVDRLQLKDLEKKRKRLEAGQKRVREELKEYGITSVEQIESHLEQIQEELRAKAENKKPGFGYQVTSFMRRLMGRDVSTQAKASLEEYLDLEQRLNANTRETRELNEEMDKLEGRKTGAIAMARSGRVYHLREAAPMVEEQPSKAGTKEVEAQIAALKEAEPSGVEDQRARYNQLEAEMESLRAEAVRGGAIPEEFDRLVAKLAKTKDKELAMLVQGYQRKMKEAEALRKEFESDARPEASMRVAAVKARAASAEQAEERFFAEQKPVAEQQVESREKLLVQEVKELGGFIEDAIKNLEGVQDEMDVLADEELFENKLKDFTVLVRKYESQGQGPVFDEALQNAEDALARYAVALNRRLTTIKKRAATAGKGQPRPRSVITSRPAQAGSFSMGQSSRRGVELSQLETPETMERNKQELVNRETEVYRTAEWRKNLIDRINEDESWRGFMHGVYEDVTGRIKQLSESGHMTASFDSPDIALDYALALFRGHARRGADNSHIYTESDRKMAQEEVKRLDGMLAWGERYKVKEDTTPEVTVGELSPEEQAEIERADLEDRMKSGSLSVTEAQANFDRVNRELETAGVMSLADKMNDDDFLKADAALRHARRAERSSKSKESVRRYKAKKAEATLVEETPEQQAQDEAEREAEQGVPSLQELIALAKSGDNDQQLSALEHSAEAPPSAEAPVMIEESPAKPEKKGTSLRATLEERLKASSKSKKRKAEESPLAQPIDIKSAKKKRKGRA